MSQITICKGITKEQMSTEQNTRLLKQHNLEFEERRGKEESGGKGKEPRYKCKQILQHKKIK